MDSLNFRLIPPINHSTVEFFQTTGTIDTPF